MTLPSSFPLSVSQINVELGRAGNAAFDILGASELALAGKAGAPISMSDFLGKSSRGITQTDKRDFVTGSPKSFATVDLGSNVGRSGNIILVQHGDINSNPGLSPTLNVNGSSSGVTRYEPHSTGDSTSGNDATGTAIFTYTGSATSATIDVTWGISGLPVGIIVLRVTGYDMSPFFTAGGSSSTLDGTLHSVALSANDAYIGIFTSGQNSSDLVWSGLTERGDELDHGAGANNRRSWAWDANMSAQTLSVGYSPFSTAQGSNCISAIALHAS